ncbi:hypothetical protein C5Y97_02515 [Blastopirellula marina]|uniref:Uncharacterized protein n=2 Tax=Blastopirellula marina TaxID=124 RepID=A0A2S8GCA5_9BACT|nr:hypothetical protein C5Y98_02515 [Blastopirellula marina]PTL46288.1 hypothetical protein C5Y97_02515 [Blastopirellula marina]
MKERDGISTDRECNRFKPILWTCLLIFFVFIAFSPVAFVYRNHLAWKCFAYKNDLIGVFEAPTKLAPQAVVPNSWRAHTLGKIRISFPSDFTREAPGELLFSGQSGKLIIHPHEISNPLLDPDLIHAKAISTDSKDYTWPLLRFEIYQADVEDFRWSMTNREVLWHTYCATLRCDSEGQEVEGLFRDDLDGIILFDGQDARFEWQSGPCGLKGMIVFVGESDPIDKVWVRTICRSMSLDCSPKSGVN